MPAAEPAESVHSQGLSRDSSQNRGNRRGPWLAGLLVLMLLAIGCKRGPTEAELRGAEYSIRKVNFEGVTRFKRRELHEYLELRPTQWFPLPKRRYFYEGLIPVDAERIVELYAAHGYYETEVIDVRVETIDRRRRDRVDLVFVIEEGPLTRVTDIEVRWPEGPPSGPPAAKRRAPFQRTPNIDPAHVGELVELREGEAFEVPVLNASARAMREHLKRAGYPYVEVRERAVVDRAAREARVEFEVLPGPFMRIGELDIDGLETVPDDAVRAELESSIGKPYSPARLDAMESRVYGLNVFSTVTVEPRDPNPDPDPDPDPDLDPDQGPDPARSTGGTDPQPAREGPAAPSGPAEAGGPTEQGGRLPIGVTVREGDPQRVRLGVGLGFEPNRWNQRLSVRYNHENLFRDLYGLTLTGRAGYAQLPNLINIEEHGPIAELDVLARKKGLLEKHLVWTLAPRIEVGIEQGYQFWTVQHRFGLSRFFTRWFQLELAHTLRYVDFFSVSPALDSGQTFLGLDFRDPYLVSYVDIGAKVFAVDNIANPNDGAVIGARYRVAGGPFGGQFDFQQINPFVRAYWRPIDRLQFATRVRLGLIFPFGNQPGAPIDLREYLGGAATVRGWGLRRLAPRVSGCGPPPNRVGSDCGQSIPVGGNSSVLGSFEVRVRLWRDLWAAGFVDGGDVREGVASFVPSEWNYSSGGGLRYDSPIGRFRLDVGFRLNDTPLSRGEPIWALHFGLGESF